MKLWSFAFAFLVCIASGSADTGVYEAECASPNIFVDQNTGETYCYRVARYYYIDNLDDQNFVEQNVANNICQKKTKLKFGGEHSLATVVPINSALENDFVLNLVNAEIAKLNEDERSRAIRRVLLGRCDNHPRPYVSFEDYSDSSYCLYRCDSFGPRGPRFGILHMGLDKGEWSIPPNSVTGSGKFSFLVCKARFKAPIAGLMAASMDNQVFECERNWTLQLTNEIVCFKRLGYFPWLSGRGSLSKVLDSLVTICGRVTFQFNESVAVQAKPLTLNSADEVTFFRDLTSGDSFMADHVLLAFNDGVYLDGSDAEHLKKMLSFSDNPGTICGAFVDLGPDFKVRPLNCGDEPIRDLPRDVYCKGRYLLNSSSAGLTAPVSNFVYDCVRASEITGEVGLHNEVFCYNVTMMTEKDLSSVDDSSDYTDLASRCEASNFSYRGEVKPGALISLNLLDEDRFVRKVLVRRFLTRMPSRKRRSFSGKFLLGAKSVSWRDGSDTKLLKDKFRSYGDIQDQTCAFLNVRSGKWNRDRNDDDDDDHHYHRHDDGKKANDSEWTIGNCTRRTEYKDGKFQLVVCKARFNATTTTTSTTITTTTTGKPTTRRLSYNLPTWPTSSARCGGWTCGVIAAIWMAWMAG